MTYILTLRPQMRFILTSTIGPWLATATAGMYIYNIVNRDMPWRGEWVWPIDWTGAVLVVVGPILAAAVAIDAGRWLSEGRLPSVHTVARPFRMISTVLLATAAPAAVVHVASVTTILFLAQPDSAASRIIGVGAIAVQLLGIFLYATVGLWCGRKFGPVMGPVAAVAAGILSYAFFGRGGGNSFTPFEYGSATSSLVTFDYSATYIVAQFALIAACTTGLLYAAMQIPTRVGSLLALAVVLTVVISEYAGPTERFVSNAAVAPTACRDGAIRICLYPEHRRFLAQVADLTTQFATAADALGAADELPKLIIERRPGEGPRPKGDNRGRIEFLPTTMSSDTVQPDDVVSALTLPWHCPQLFGAEPPPQLFFETQERMSYTLFAQSGIVQKEVEPLSAEEFKRHLNNRKACVL